uniref:Uncharacterized protein n=1 Tax=Panagrolaimus sp. ES5 TaxID=591445 RepID=A0AC34G5Q0_9BILA
MNSNLRQKFVNCERVTSTSSWGTRTFDKKTWTDVIHPTFEGVSIHANGTAKFTAANLANCSIFGKNGVELLSLITKNKSSKSKSYLWGLEAFKSSDDDVNEVSHGTNITGKFDIHSSEGDVNSLDTKFDGINGNISGKNVKMETTVLKNQHETANLNSEKLNSQSGQYENQVLSIKKLTVENCETATLKNANLNAEEIKGTVGKLNIISDCSTKKEDGMTVESEWTFYLINGIPTPLPTGFSYKSSQFSESKVHTPSGIHSTSSFANFHVGHLYDEGGVISFAGDVNKFYNTATFKNIEEKSRRDKFKLGAEWDYFLTPKAKFPKLNSVGFECTSSNKQETSITQPTIASTTNGNVETKNE